MLAAVLLLAQRLAAAGGAYRNPIARNVADPFDMVAKQQSLARRTLDSLVRS